MTAVVPHLRPVAAAPALHTLFEETCDRVPGPVAVDAFGTSLTYDEVDRRANQLARYLRLRGAVRANGSRCCPIIRSPPTSAWWPC